MVGAEQKDSRGCRDGGKDLGVAGRIELEALVEHADILSGFHQGDRESQQKESARAPAYFSIVNRPLDKRVDSPQAGAAEPLPVVGGGEAHHAAHLGEAGTHTLADAIP
jgi:hypothetical protein